MISTVGSLEESQKRPFSRHKFQVISITTQTEFESAIKAEKAIIFITFEWSGQAIQSEFVVNEWRSKWHSLHKDLDIAFFKLEPEVVSFTHDWVYNTVKESGFGSLVWIKEGAIVDYERFAAAAGVSDISRRTESIFRN